MVRVRRIVLDVLKPHHPTSLEFAQQIAAIEGGYHVSLNVNEMDENTETVQIEISGRSVDFERVQEVINGMGGSIHSIDQVEVEGGGTER